MTHCSTIIEEQRKRKIKETFDSLSQGYDNQALRFFAESAAYLAALLPLQGKKRVIDIATGTGHAALAIASRFPEGHVTGIDFSPGMLDQARKKASLRDIQNVEFFEMDMQRLDFGAEKFDAAVCAFGIWFVDDMESQLSRIMNITKPNGTIAICNFHQDYFHPLRDLMIKRLTHYNVQPPAETWKLISTESGCRNLFEKAGIQNINVEQKNMGYFLSNEKEWWELVWNAGFRWLLNQLHPSELAQFKKEHMQEVAALATKDGIWLDIKVLFTTGTQSNYGIK